jgi:hypothetical protein
MSINRQARIDASAAAINSCTRGGRERAQGGRGEGGKGEGDSSPSADASLEINVVAMCAIKRKQEFSRRGNQHVNQPASKNRRVSRGNQPLDPGRVRASARGKGGGRKGGGRQLTITPARIGFDHSEYASSTRADLLRYRTAAGASSNNLASVVDQTVA